MKKSAIRNNQNLKTYTNLVAKGLLSQFENKVKKYVGLDEESMAKMIGGHHRLF